MLGYKDDEMTARWTQYGIFFSDHASPQLIAVTSTEKEPWRFKKGDRGLRWKKLSVSATE